MSSQEPNPTKLDKAVADNAVADTAVGEASVGELPDSGVPVATPHADTPDGEALSVWLRPERKLRHRAPRTRREIARAAIAVVDRGGPDALTMRRVAAELGIATMSLYSYVSSKDELMDLVADEMLAEIVIAHELPHDWRDALTLIARRTRAFFLNHPWVISYLDLPDPAVGPNMLRHMEQSLAAVASLPLDQLRRRSVPRIVDHYVFGAALDAIDDQRQREFHGARHRARAEGTRRFVLQMLESGDFPNLAAAHEAGGALPYLDDEPETMKARFERGLQWLLDGIAAAASQAAADAGAEDAGADSRRESPLPEPEPLPEPGPALS